MTAKQNNRFYLVIFLSFTMAVSSCVRIPSADGNSIENQSSNTIRSLIVNQSYQKIGTPYRYGGSTASAFDCSGLTQYVYRAAGINIPRTTEHQLRESQTISYQQLLPGDLAFYKTSAKSRHVGIYIGNNQMIHASTGSKQVRTTNITDRYWRQRFTKFGRFVK